jgi:hypothetical protein
MLKVTYTQAFWFKFNLTQRLNIHVHDYSLISCIEKFKLYYLIHEKIFNFN